MVEQTHPHVAGIFHSHSFADNPAFLTPSLNHLKQGWNDPSGLRDLDHRLLTHFVSQTHSFGDDGQTNLRNQVPDHLPPGEEFELPEKKRHHLDQDEMANHSRKLSDMDKANPSRELSDTDKVNPLFPPQNGNSEKAVEIALYGPLFPANSLTSALFSRLFKQFYEFIHQNDWAIRSRESRFIESGSQRLPDKSRLEPILQNAGIIDMIYDPQRIPFTKRSIETRMKNLVQWFVYINAAVMRQHDKASRNDQSEEKSHQELLDWFFIQVVSSLTSQDLIRKFSQGCHRDRTVISRGRLYWPKERDNSLEISFLAMNIWYERFKYETWRDMGGTKEKVLRKMRSLVDQAIHSDFKVDEHVEEEISHLGNFKIESFQKLPSSLRPPRREIQFRCPADVGVEAIWEKLLGELYDFRGKMRTPDRKLIDPPIALVPAGRKKKYWLIRLVDTPEIIPQPVSRQILLRNMEFFLANIYVFHRSLLDYTMTDKTFEVKKSFQRQFFSWLHDVMFLENQEGSKLPVFGKIEAKDIPQINSSHFGPIQVYLIKYLNNQAAYKRVVHVALTLLGYWYKKYHPDWFFSKFETDESYWRQMIEFLEKDQIFYVVISE